MTRLSFLAALSLLQLFLMRYFSLARRQLQTSSSSTKYDNTTSVLTAEANSTNITLG